MESVLGATPHEFESRILRQCLTGHDVEGPHRSRWGPSTCVVSVAVFGLDWTSANSDLIHRARHCFPKPGRTRRRRPPLPRHQPPPRGRQRGGGSPLLPGRRHNRHAEVEPTGPPRTGERHDRCLRQGEQRTGAQGERRHRRTANGQAGAHFRRLCIAVPELSASMLRPRSAMETSAGASRQERSADAMTRANLHGFEHCSGGTARGPFRRIPVQQNPDSVPSMACTTCRTVISGWAARWQQGCRTADSVSDYRGFTRC